ncbi:hypothetical protein [Salipiger bermudensis]|uniref:hypothetical protein n=1 Tax=Salipiger bermudensis TaxID=344736 RepID=UPI001CD3473E|nr:hypothetical protein [Salipiger bermudensis]MCA0961975.1 hypothetical protein [Salipiger bermudensis]
MKFFIQVACVATACAPAFAQDSMTRTDMSNIDMTAVPSIQEWQPVKDTTTREDVIEALGSAGWQSGDIEMQLPNVESYEFYARPLAPGTTSYLAIPNADGGQPIEFAPSLAAGSIRQVGWPGSWIGGPSQEEIRQEIVNGMEAAIAALCEMQARPNTIRAQASAFGIVEIEATWSSAEVCEP